MVHFEYIETQEQLQRAALEWCEEKELAIDLECENNLHHYGTFISLIQLSSRSKHWVVDVLVLKEIQLLLDVFLKDTILKVFHDISFDFRILFMQFKCVPRYFFDTQVAALFLGEEKLGLGSLLEKYFQIICEKKFQQMDWTRRPLSKPMLEYASGDTAHLLGLKDVLCDILRERGRVSWVEEECRYLEGQDYTLREQEYKDISGFRSMSVQERAILHVLFDERRKLGRVADKPLFMIFSNKQMLAFVKNPPYNVEGWKRLHGVHPLVKENAVELFRLVEEARTGGGEEYVVERKEKLAPRLYELMLELGERRNVVAKSLGLRGHLLLSEEQMRDMVVGKSFGMLRGWQRELWEKEEVVRKVMGVK